jgi:hypothetical protein
LDRGAFAILVNVENGIFLPSEHRLTDEEWDVIEMGKCVLKPIMFAQRVLEGELYVTNSLVAPIMFEIRAHLARALAEQQQRAAANAINIEQCLEKVIIAFEERLYKCIFLLYFLFYYFVII